MVLNQRLYYAYLIHEKYIQLIHIFQWGESMFHIDVPADRAIAADPDQILQSGYV
jgi:hypothetical protein